MSGGCTRGTCVQPGREATFVFGVVVGLAREDAGQRRAAGGGSGQRGGGVVVVRRGMRREGG